MLNGNTTTLDAASTEYQFCTVWGNETEGAFYHLGNTLLWLGYMGGSGAYGALYIFGCLAPAFLCHAVWGWRLLCGSLPVVVWSSLLGALCLLQLAHLLYQLHRNWLPGEEFRNLYSGVYLPLGVPVSIFKEVSAACDSQVLSLGEEEAYALEGKTVIDRLSFLLSGRIRVSLEGQFLHYIFPYQFLDSPEWESLKPTEEGNFQVTLTAETDCRYISWRRRKLYLLLSRDRYIARLFSVMLGSDIADKLYSLNDKLFARSNVRLDIRLPSLYHVLAPPSADPGSAQQISHSFNSSLGLLEGNADSPAVHDLPRPRSLDMERLFGDHPPGQPRLHWQRRRAPLVPTDTPSL
ncbi:popeye domain-containing 2 isoform X2 [Paramormyrops kingsleyae]|uniref:Popeye domain cAMP effector 2 n=1 Tax=Paramormyrops kingsleyae TaxID=1676925 RepID=A0A3B3QTC6_9TELE|nr:popeye domain-containing protein 2 [Paramormyrops kingsleyae]